VIALCEGYRVNVGWANPAGGSGFNTLYVCFSFLPAPPSAAVRAPAWKLLVADLGSRFFLAFRFKRLLH